MTAHRKPNAVIPTMRKKVDALCLKRLGKVPNLRAPQGYNDLIQWLKLHDQTPEHIVACDKYAVRDIVEKRAGPEHLNKCYYVANQVLPNDFGDDNGNWLPYMLKATHDSGSVYKVECHPDYEYAKKRLTLALKQPYGVHKGEWAYAMIKPRVMAEAVMPGPIVDYKFHCSHGEVRWVQVIWARDTGAPREAIFTPDGTVTKLHMDHKMAHTPLQRMYPGDDEWARLTEVALKLAAGWRYVRVDLYFVREWNEVKFGELTFWPLSGSYKTKDEPKFGEMLNLDLSYSYEPLVR